MINWEKFLFIPRSALGHFPLKFLCSEISGGTLHLSVPLVQPRPRCNGFAQVRIENLVPGLLYAQSKTPSKYRFTIVSLIVPVYPYSCGFRALIEAVN